VIEYGKRNLGFTSLVCCWVVTTAVKGKRTDSMIPVPVGGDIGVVSTKSMISVVTGRIDRRTTRHHKYSDLFALALAVHPLDYPHYSAISPSGEPTPTILVDHYSYRPLARLELAAVLHQQSALHS
jgi:hypothetical protein